MKILLTAKVKDKKIPIGYRMTILSLIKKAISMHDKDYFEELFFYEGKKTKKIKPFTFSVFFTDYKINSDFIEVNGDIKITISSADKKLIMILINSFMDIKSYGSLTNISARLQKTKEVRDEVEIFKTLSPIYIKDSNNRALEIDDPNYNKELNYFLDIYLRSYRGYGLKKAVEFTPIKMKKVVVKEEIKDFNEAVSKKHIYINAYSGIFKLEGDIEDLNLISAAGIGARRSSGFGCIDIC